MKRLAFTLLVLFVLAVGFGFAAGTRESESQDETVVTPRWNAQRQNEEQELVELQGKIKFVGYGYPLLVSDGTDYELHYPLYLTEEVELQDGQSIFVKGYLAPMEWCPEDTLPEDTETSNRLIVASAIINGQEYDLSEIQAAKGFAGPQGFKGSQGIKGPQGFSGPQSYAAPQGPATGPDFRGQVGRGRQGMSGFGQNPLNEQEGNNWS